MATLTIRELDDTAKAGLQALAAANGRQHGGGSSHGDLRPC